MFLSATESRNRPLIEAAFALHQAGRLSPDTYVVDRDAVDHNAAALAAAAAAHGVELWFVVKQIGRNPLLSRTIARHLPHAAAIDVHEADALDGAGVALGNVGHLVQIPVRDLPRVLARRPRVVTVYDLENLRAVAAESARQGRVQDVLLRMAGDPSSTYPGQEGGFAPDDVAAVHRAAAGMTGVRIAGVTGFPCLLFGPDGTPEPTPTLHQVLAAADTLRSLGVPDVVVDLPSGSSVATVAELAAWGATHAEPGHALTGTTPQHAHDLTLPEVPAMVYLTEVAQHCGQDRPRVFGGGFYPRGQVRSALVRTATGDLHTGVLPGPAENIDYYRTLDPQREDAARIHVGDPVIMAFRTQVFVTRSRLAVVSGLRDGRPRIDGIFDALGRPLDEAAVAACEVAR